MKSGGGGDFLDARLLARFERLKEESHGHPLQQDSEIVGSHLANRLAALKPPQTHVTETRKPETWGLPAGRRGLTSDALEVEKLLESISDEVRLHKSEAPTHHHGLDEESSDSDVDNIVEWAKDAAALDLQLAEDEEEEEEEDEEADPVLDGNVSSVHVTGTADPTKKKKDLIKEKKHVTGTADPMKKKKELIKEKKHGRWKFW